MYKFKDLDFDKVFVSKVLQIVEEDLNVNESASHQKIARLRNALDTVADKFDEFNSNSLNLIFFASSLIIILFFVLPSPIVSIGSFAARTFF